MSIGSAFDAHVKCALHTAIFGQNNDPDFQFEALFEKQVEPHNRDWAKEHGKYCFEAYKKSGAYADLLLELKQSTKEPKFEIEIRGVVESSQTDLTRTMGNMVLLGKPDLYFHNKAGFPVILDWKVNGYCSKSAKSPEKGYVRIRHCDGITATDKAHKAAQLCNHNGALINLAHPLEEVSVDWASQLSVYGWLLGEDVGGEFLTFIDQIVGAPDAHYPKLRIAEHRTRISKTFQEDLYKRACYVWDVIHSDHIFRDMPKLESQAKCQKLDAEAQVSLDMAKSEDPELQLLGSMINVHRNF